MSGAAAGEKRNAVAVEIDGGSVSGAGGGRKGISDKGFCE